MSCSYLPILLFYAFLPLFLSVQFCTVQSKILICSFVNLEIKYIGMFLRHVTGFYLVKICCNFMTSFSFMFHVVTCETLILYYNS